MVLRSFAPDDVIRVIGELGSSTYNDVYTTNFRGDIVSAGSLREDDGVA